MYKELYLSLQKKLCHNKMSNSSFIFIRYLLFSPMTKVVISYTPCIDLLSANQTTIYSLSIATKSLSESKSS